MNFNKKSEVKRNRFIKIRRNKKEAEKVYKYRNLKYLNLSKNKTYK
jgi:hypothetical protein